ncbi:MAG: flagellar basal body rod protein FlgB [Pseudomonadota bacterium]
MTAKGDVPVNLLKSSLLSSLTQRLEFLSQRSAVIAENIANADTPDYAARDVKKPDFSSLARTAALKVSDPRHLQGARSAAAGEIVRAPDGDAALNGNRVSLETQMVKLSETRMGYQMASTVYRKGLDLMRIAVRGGRS